MKRSCHILIAAALGLLPGALMAADGQDAAAPQSAEAAYQPVYTNGQAWADGQPQFLGRGSSSQVSDPIVRFGWWGTHNSGSPTKIGEWQSLDSSPFFDVDGLSSDGTRTFNYSIWGLDNDSTPSLGVNYYGPHVGATVDYQRYMRRLDHDPIANFRDTGGEASPYIGRVTDLNVGQDYAIRVQEFDARFHGNISENVKWRLNVWGMRKEGERQADAFSHSCRASSAGNSPARRPCHIGSQDQKIDWLTTEIEPVIEGKAGPLTVEYSRTMRGFTQNDDGVFTGAFSATSAAGSFNNYPTEFVDSGVPGNSHQYGIVPDNYTQIDRLKFGLDITDDTDLYALLYYGDTENKDRFTHRTFHGWDLRLTNRSIDGVTVVGYAKQNTENNQLPTTFPEDPIFQDGFKPSQDVRHPINRDRTAVGAKARWLLGQRRYASSGWSLAGGYEYSTIEREFVEFEGHAGDFIQPTTTSHTIYIGPEWRVSKSLDTFFRYKMVNSPNPLYGFRENQQESPNIDPETSFDFAVNTNQPQHVDGVEFGGTWTPADNFLVNATIGLEKRSHLSRYAAFDEDNYPIFVSAWWAPTQKLSLSAGVGFLSNFIDQNIQIGVDERRGAFREQTDSVPFDYNGRADVVSLGAAYACTERIKLVGGLEWVRGINRINDPSIPGLDMTYIPGAFDVIVETWRMTAGVDYILSPRNSIYFRYVYFDYNDKSFARTATDPDPNSGTSNMFLGGFSATF